MSDSSPSNRLLRVFLCHGSEDKPVVRGVYHRLRDDGVNPWFDEQDILPGQDWDLEIKSAVRSSDAILVCLSPTSVSKSGYVQKEIKFALDAADEKPDGTLFIIPVKLEECEVPRRLSQWQWVQYSDTEGYSRIIRALRVRATQCDLRVVPGDGIERTVQPVQPSSGTVIYETADLQGLLRRAKDGDI